MRQKFPFVKQKPTNNNNQVKKYIIVLEFKQSRFLSQSEL